MKISRRLGLSAALASVLACSTNPAPPPPPISTALEESGRPSLAVLVVVDQLRADLLDRYGDLFTGGFKRLRDNGHSYVNAAHDHAATETAVGHATLATGVYPSRHGVIANIWYEMSGGQWVPVSNVGDSTVTITGAKDRQGASPHYMMRAGFADWLVRANPRSRIASVSGKDRGAILPAAHVRDAYVYWFDSPSGRFVTSTWYRSADPDWIGAFNAHALQAHRADSVWSLEVPASMLARANRDTIPTEGNGTNTYFPHRFATEGTAGAFWQWWATTPALDAATLELAESMVRSLELGHDETPDFLNVSLSATDYVGHGYGPLSREQLDNLLRLDRELGQFFDYLDSTVGRNRWTVTLTADHGVLDSPEDLVARGEYGHRLTQSEFATLNSMAARADSNPDKSAAARELAGSLKRLPIIADAWTHEELAKPQTDSFAVLRQRSMWPGREESAFSRRGVEFRFIPGVLSLPRGSSHGQVYWYDRHVPLIFMGPGIPAGRDSSRAATVDFAPTISVMLGIPYPADLDGKLLRAVIGR
jgi:predicted AlkP superfamily pyrophosphatase or phosphodiesterase